MSNACCLFNTVEQSQAFAFLSVSPLLTNNDFIVEQFTSPRVTSPISVNA